MLYPLLFEANLFPVVWGGHRLREIKGMTPDNEPVGESWDVSAVPQKESIVANGVLKGRDLRTLAEEYGATLMGQSVYARFGNKFPLLFKLIDAERDLSIQVHPDNTLAMQRHGCLGKTEMWYVLDAKPGACLYAGFSKDITPEEYRQRIADGTICDVLAKHHIHAGDAFFIPAGRVHSICSGALVAEVQQSSDITYRIYDYDRLGMDGKPRELHTELAVDALEYHAPKEYSLSYTRDKNTPNKVCSCDFFEVCWLSMNQPMHRQMFQYDSFVIYMCLRGECHVGDDLILRRGQTCLIPAECASDIVFTPIVECGDVEMLEIYIPSKD